MQRPVRLLGAVLSCIWRACFLFTNRNSGGWRDTHCTIPIRKYIRPGVPASCHTGMVDMGTSRCTESIQSHLTWRQYREDSAVS
jgi:hypothetical protein